MGPPPPKATRTRPTLCHGKLRSSFNAAMHDAAHDVMRATATAASALDAQPSSNTVSVLQPVTPRAKSGDGASDTARSTPPSHNAVLDAPLAPRRAGQAQHLPPDATMTMHNKPFIPKTDKYLSEEAKFTRDRHGVLRYNGRPVCRYLNTARGCHLGPSCRYEHLRLGCVFHRFAVQRCCFGEEGVGCAFSHSPDAVVVSAPLKECSTPSCLRSCMSNSSVCKRCWNGMARMRRALAHQSMQQRSAAPAAYRSNGGGRASDNGGWAPFYIPGAGQVVDACPQGWGRSESRSGATGMYYGNYVPAYRGVSVPPAPAPQFYHSAELGQTPTLSVKAPAIAMPGPGIHITVC